MKKFSLLAFSLVMLFSQIAAVKKDVRFTELSEDRLQAVVDNMELAFICTEPEKEPICCFDIADSGIFAVGTRTMQQNQARVFSEAGAFLYGYTFTTEGSFALEIEENRLNIFLVKSDIIISVDDEGHVIGGAKINDAKESSGY